MPVLRKQLAVPITHYTALDGQYWQNSPHVQFDNSTPWSNYIIQQIRFSHVDRPVSFDLIQKAHKVYSSIASNERMLQICHQQDDQCLVQAPPLFRDEKEWKEKSRYTHILKYESHPFSIYANVSFDQQGDYMKSDAIMLSFLLKQQPETLNIWSNILSQVEHDNLHKTTVKIPSYMIQYKFKLFPYDIPSKIQLLIALYIITFYLVSLAFGKSNLVKSGYTFGLAAMFLSMACFTTAWGITDRLGITLNNVPWSLLLLVVNIACLENIFLLTNAVLNAGCDMSVKEKISRGLQSVGLPMTTTLVAEIIIMTVGTAMDILADLDNRNISKRLYEIGNHDKEIKQQPPELCPIQDTDKETESKSCAECKDFKTHRVFNALILCFIVLGLSLFTKKDKSPVYKKVSTHRIKKIYPDYQTDIYNLSQQFWSIVNPEKEPVWVRVDPPLLFIYNNTPQIESYVNKIQAYYSKKSLAVQYKPEVLPSPFRLVVHSVVQRIVIFLLGINIPALILWVCLIAIITWMTPKWRDQWLLPLLVRTFNKSVLAILGFIWSIRDLYKAYIKGIKSRYEYDADGLHRGAIMTQAIFNKEHSHIKGIHVQTLSHQHVADIQNLDVNAKGSLVSCGQDGRLVLWDTIKAVWVARLDSLCTQGRVAGTMNPDYKTSRRSKRMIQPSSESLPKPLYIKVDRGNKWIATSHEDQTIRIWSRSECTLVNILSINKAQTIRNRFHKTTPQVSDDRILDIQFVEDDFYLSNSETRDEQNLLLSVHRSGLVREWNVMTGECVSIIETGHMRQVTQLHVDYQLIFTASKDGTIKCWKRHLRDWSLVYTVNHHSAVSCIATKEPVSGMGILVSGSVDGAVKVWNFETGKLVCTLSEGKLELGRHKDVTGPIRYFSNFSDLTSDNMSDTDSVTSHHTAEEKHNQGAIQQLVVSRYCEAENGLCFCDGYSVCFGNGFLVASSGSENKVYAWRIKYKGMSNVNEGSCTLLPRDYHRKQYKRHKLDEGVEPAKRLRSPSLPKKIIGRYAKNASDAMPGIVDIEQIADRVQISLYPVFLGEIDQPAGHGLVFCDKVLAGVRRIKGPKIEWEAWFAPLQYCEPATRDNPKISVETFGLDRSAESLDRTKSNSFLKLFRSKTNAGSVVVKPRYKQICMDDEEAGENLPFSTIRHVVSLDGRGLACDYGNFIKLVYIDNKQSLTEREMTRQARILKEKTCDCPADRRGEKACCGGEKKKEKVSMKNIECSLKYKCSRAADCVAAASSSF